MAATSQVLVLLLTFAVSVGATTVALRWRASLRRRLADALRRRFPGATVTRGEDRWLVTLGERTVRVPIARVLAARELGEGRVEAEIVHVLAETDRAFRRVSALEEERDPVPTLVPVLLAADRAEVVGDEGRFTVPLGDGVEIGFVVEDPASDRWLTISDREAIPLDAEALLAAARTNLRARSDGVAVVREDLPGREVYVIRHGDGLDGSRMLLHDLWANIAELAGDDLLLCAPTRDRVYAAPARQPVSIDRMVRHVSEDWVYRPHGVSPRIWVYSGDRLVPWSTHS